MVCMSVLHYHLGCNPPPDPCGSSPVSSCFGRGSPGGDPCPSLLWGKGRWPGGRQTRGGFPMRRWGNILRDYCLCPGSVRDWRS